MNFILLLKNHPLGVVLLLLPLAIVAKNLAGAIHGIQEQKFNFDYFRRGLFKGLSLYILFALISLMAWVSSDLLVNIGGTDYTLIQALVLILWGAIIIYIKDTFIIIQLIFNQSTTKEDL